MTFCALYPVSSSNSRIAACSAVSPLSIKPVASVITPVFVTYLRSRTCGKLCGVQVGENNGNVPTQENDVPTTNAFTGGRYCSMITVEVGNALVSERKMASTATASLPEG